MENVGFLNAVRAVLCIAAAFCGFSVTVTSARAEVPAMADTGCPANSHNCLAYLLADVDNDGQADETTITYFPHLGIYSVEVVTSLGIRYHPFDAGHDPRRDRVKLTFRKGVDYRCRDFKPPRTQCGYAWSTAFAEAATFLSDSRHGDFVLILLFPHLKSNTKPTDGRYVVMPALDRLPGRPTRPF